MTPDEETLNYAARRLLELLVQYDAKPPYTFYTYYMVKDKEAVLFVLKDLLQQIQQEIEAGTHVQNTDQVL